MKFLVYDGLMAKILKFRSTYSAALKEVATSGLVFKTAGTLDGFVDLAVVESDGTYRTYNISCDGAQKLSDALSCVLEDIKKNCLYDRDVQLTR